MLNDESEVQGAVVNEAGPILFKGYLNKRTDAIQQFKRRFCVLRADNICYSEEEGSKALGAIDLTVAIYTAPSLEKDVQFAFDLVVPKRLFVLQAENREDYTAWTAAVKKCIRNEPIKCRKEGAVLKQSEMGKAMKNRYIAVARKNLFYFDTYLGCQMWKRRALMDAEGALQNYAKGAIALNDPHVVHIERAMVRGAEHGFVVSVTNVNRIYLFGAQTEEEANEWVAQIKEELLAREDPVETGNWGNVVGRWEQANTGSFASPQDLATLQEERAKEGGAKGISAENNLPLGMSDEKSSDKKKFVPPKQSGGPPTFTREKEPESSGWCCCFGSAPAPQQPSAGYQKIPDS